MAQNIYGPDTDAPGQNFPTLTPGGVLWREGANPIGFPRPIANLIQGANATLAITEISDQLIELEFAAAPAPVGPVGPPGPTGIQGVQGAQGPGGLQGSPGPAGAIALTRASAGAGLNSISLVPASTPVLAIAQIALVGQPPNPVFYNWSFASGSNSLLQAYNVTGQPGFAGYSSAAVALNAGVVPTSEYEYTSFSGASVAISRLAGGVDNFIANPIAGNAASLLVLS